MFDEGERWWLDRLDERVAAAGFDTFLPHRENPARSATNAREVFGRDRDAVDQCDLIVASLNGLTTDDGTAWELGYAYAKGTPAIGIHTDWRRRFLHESVNLMIECSLDSVVHSLDELDVGLAAWRAKRSVAPDSTPGKES